MYLARLTETIWLAPVHLQRSHESHATHETHATHATHENGSQHAQTQQRVLEEARRLLEGSWVRCGSSNTNVLVAVVHRLASFAPGAIDERGLVECSVVADCLVAAPFVGEVLDVTITVVNDTGFFADGGCVNVMVSSNGCLPSCYVYDRDRVAFVDPAGTLAPIVKDRQARVRIDRIGDGPWLQSKASMVGADGRDCDHLGVLK